jgi:outer membrane protein assembly factor BamB
MSTRHLLASTLGFALLAATAAADDWPCYLGPNRNLISAEKGLKLWAGDAAKVLWKKNVGQGHSSVVVVGKHLYTQGAGTVWCLDAETGEAVWTHPPLQGGKPGRGETTATPAVADGQVFALNSDGTFLCLDAAKGQLQWSKKVSEFGVKAGGWPLSGSPLVQGDHVIMDLGVIFILNRKTGELVSKTGSQTAGYSSALVFSRGNEKLTTSFDAAGLSVYALAGGQSVAKYPWETAHKVKDRKSVV